jgi:hypothetical protein
MAPTATPPFRATPTRCVPITPEDTAKAFISSGMLRRVWQPVEGAPLPTLREMIERDERVVVMADNDASGVDWYLQAHDYVQDTPFRFRTAAEFSCEPFRGRPENPLFAVNHWLGSAFPSPQATAEVNAFDVLYERVRQCERERGRMANIIVVNFSEVGDAHLVVDVLNGVAEPPAEEERVEAGG